MSAIGKHLHSLFITLFDTCNGMQILPMD